MPLAIAMPGIALIQGLCNRPSNIAGDDSCKDAGGERVCSHFKSRGNCKKNRRNALKYCKKSCFNCKGNFFFLLPVHFFGFPI